MASSSPERILILKSKEGDEFEIKESAAMMSTTIKNLVDEGLDESGKAIILYNVASKDLSKVTEYLNKIAEFSDNEEDQKKKKAFDNEFIQEISTSYDDMFELILAANYLALTDLLESLCNKVANQIKDKMPEEIREIFNIENDYTEEEEKAIRAEHEWAFDI